MGFTEFEQKRYGKLAKDFVESRRPPLEIRNEVDLKFRVTDKGVEIFEIRAKWDNAKEKLEIPVAKATYVKKTNLWKIYWKRADLKWHQYDPCPEVNQLEEFLSIVDEDEYCCFWG